MKCIKISKVNPNSPRPSRITRRVSNETANELVSSYPFITFSSKGAWKSEGRKYLDEKALGSIKKGETQ